MKAELYNMMNYCDSDFKATLRLYDTENGIRVNDTSPYAKYGTIPEWNVSLITDMTGAFEDQTMFNGNISRWDMALVLSVVGHCKLSIGSKPAAKALGL